MSNLRTLGQFIESVADKPLREARAEFQREYFRRLIAETGGVMQDVMRRSGMNCHATTHRQINQLGLRDFLGEVRRERG